MSAPEALIDVPEHGLAERLGEAFELEQEDSSESESVEPASEAEEDPEPEPESEDDDAEKDVGEEPEEEPGEEPEEEPEPEPEGEDEQDISSLEDLAAAFEVETDELAKNLRVTLGEESVPLSEVIERAGQAPPPAQMAQMLEEQRGAVTQAEATRQQTFNESEAVFLGAVNVLLSDAEERAGFSEAEMANLRQSDPEAWAIKSEERRQFYAKVDQSVAAAREHQAQRTGQTAEVFQQRAIEEGTKLVNAIPEWQDHNLAMWEATLIAQSTQENYGFTPEEMNEMPDHRLALAFRDAHRYHKLVEGAVAKKKTLDSKKLKARRSVVPTRPKRAKGDPRKTSLAVAKKRQRETIGRRDRVKEHEDAATERFGEFF